MSLQIATMLLGNTAAGTASSSDAMGSCAGMGGNGGLTLLLFYAAVIGVFYLILIRPQKKKREQEEQLRKSVEIGDEIITIGGICGRIVSIKDDETLVIETGADRNKLKMKNWAISTNVTAKNRQAELEPEKKQGFLEKLFAKKETPEE